MEDCPPAFLPLATKVQALSDAVSLSSGLGLVEIWSTFFVGSHPTPSSTELIAIDKLASCLKDSHISSALSPYVFSFLSKSE